MDEWIEQDFMIMIEPEDCEAYKMPEGVLLIGRADQFASQGFVDIDPGKTLPPRSRSAPGSLKQMAGESIVTISGEQKILKTGDSIPIPLGTEYSIQNPTQGKCVVYWKFSGDVSEVFLKMMKELPKLPFQAREKSGYKDMFEDHKKRQEELQGNRK